MEDIIKIYLKKYYKNISDECVETFKSLVTFKSFKKGSTILKHAEFSTKFYIVREGLVGTFVKNDDDQNFIRTICTPSHTIGALTSLIKNEPSNASYKALTPCEVIEVDYYEFIRLSEKHLDFAILRAQVLQHIHITSESRIEDLSLLDSTERYLKLKKDILNIDNLLPQYQIACYLNITPVQLSRIRKKLYSK